MIRNYIKIAWRNLWSNKLFSLINIISLAIGFSASFVIGLMVYYDLTFDKFHPDGEYIYRVTSNFYSPEDNFYNPGVPVPLRSSIEDNVAGLETVSSFFTYGPLKVKNNTTEAIYKNPQFVVFTDQSYFDLFEYKWLAGNTQDILSKPNTVVLTEERAKKYFPNQDLASIIGKTLIYNDSINVDVTGIVAGFKKRTDFVFQEFLSLGTVAQTEMKDQYTNDNWNSTSSSSQLFVKLNKNIDAKEIQSKLDQLAVQHEDEESIKYNEQRKFYLQPLSDIHFNENYGIYDYSQAQANKSVLVALTCIALFLLLLGCINFINLSTAQATQRAKEIGIRKTLGGSKKQLILQFLGETFMLTLAAGIVSLFLAYWLLEVFSDFTPAGLNFSLFNEPVIITFSIVLLLAVTLLSGIYPSLVLTHFKPVSVLKNDVFSQKSKPTFRRFLTVFQFSIAQVFIIATLLVGKQIHYMMNKDMGFKTEAIAFVTTPWNDSSRDKKLRYIKELRALPQIKDVSLGGSPPASFNTHTTSVSYFNDQKEIRTDLEQLYGDTHYLDLYNIELLAGRKRLNDTIREFVINETYLKVLGFKQPKDAIGQMLKIDEESYPIVGVMKDFNQRSLKSQIKPMALLGDWDTGRWTQFYTIHIALANTGDKDWNQTIAAAEAKWKSIYPDSEFRLQFIDETISRFYQREQRMSVLLKWATGLSVLISCLGLLGLVIYTTERRTKEIGIRKILGASIAQINLLLCRDFLILVGAAFIIAIPIAWWGLDNWLRDFSYKTSLSWWIFAISGLGMVCIALLIMSIKTVATAMENPVKSLRTE